MHRLLVAQGLAEERLMARLSFHDQWRAQVECEARLHAGHGTSHVRLAVFACLMAAAVILLLVMSLDP